LTLSEFRAALALLRLPAKEELEVLRVAFDKFVAQERAARDGASYRDISDIPFGEPEPPRRPHLWNGHV
jgi:hypothetical protein